MNVAAAWPALIHIRRAIFLAATFCAVPLLLATTPHASADEKSDYRCVQDALLTLGFDVGTPDGVVGPRTRAAAEVFMQIAGSNLGRLEKSTSRGWCTITTAAAATHQAGNGPDFDAARKRIWLGYKPIEEAPPLIRSLAESSVVQLRTVNQMEAKQDKYEVVETNSVEPVTDSKVLDNDLRALQVETCRRQNLEKCPIFTSMDDGTAYIENGRDLYTCRHLVHNWSRIAARLNQRPLLQISPPMKLISNDGRVLYNSTDLDAEMIKVEAWNTDPRIDIYVPAFIDFNIKKQAAFTMSEFVAMKAGADLVPPSVAKVDPVAVGERVYFAGYPGATHVWSGASLGDSPGNALVVSTGTIYEVIEPKKMFNSKGFTNPGMSGGLVMNEAGHVLGITCSGNSTEEGVDPLDAGTGSIFLDLEEQKKLWLTLLYTPFE